MSLTTTSKTFRKGIKILGVFAFLYYLMILFIIPNVRDAILNAFVDRDPPNPKHGPLEALKFTPVEIKNTTPPEYVLDTKDGRLPAGFPKKMKIYNVKPAQYSYLAGKNAQQDASILGFKETELISDLKGKEYQWQSLTSGGFLTIDTETRAISLYTDLIGRNVEFKPGTIDPEAAKDYTINILRSLGRYNEDLYRKENFKVVMGQLLGNTMSETKVVAQAQFARVDLFGKIGEYNIYGPNAQTGTIAMVVRAPKADSPFNVPVFLGSFWNIDTNTDATYPIITVAEAWKQVQTGKGIVSSAVPKNYNPFINLPQVTLERVLIKRIYLAYYITPEYQKYLQPIYVFEGSYITSGTEGGSIYIYYPAVTAQYTKATQ